MKNQFKIAVLMLITSFQVQTQTETETLYSKSYEINENTTALLEFKGSNVEIYKSQDDKFYIEYTIDFMNYPDRKKREVRENVNIESKLINNRISLVDKSKFNMYRFLQFEAVTGSLYSKNQSAITSYEYKSEEVFDNQIIEAKKPISFYIRYIQNSDRYDENEKKKMIEKYNDRKRKKFKKRIKIKVPNNLSLIINSKASNIRFRENLENQVSLRADGGKVYVNTLNNNNNIIKIKDASLVASYISGGAVILDNSKRTIIGELKNVSLNSEFSQLEIGSINTNVEITDFTSKYLIHNFSKDFENFNMNSEYSEVSLFLPKNGSYKLTTFGNDTKHFVDNKVFNLNDKNKRPDGKMFQLNSGDSSTLNHIKINTVNSIIRITKNDVINFGE